MVFRFRNLLVATGLSGIMIKDDDHNDHNVERTYEIPGIYDIVSKSKVHLI
jgi:hypothetical protein